MPPSDSDYSVTATSTDTFGRVLLTARNQHLVVDGPEKNGCPGEAITPAELFLGGVASCAVELIEVIAKEGNVSVDAVRAHASGAVDRSHAVRADVTVFQAIRLEFELAGVGDEDAAALVEAFKGR